MLPDEPNDEERLEEVDNDDNSTPFQAADDVADDGIDDTHPATDSEAQPEEIYNSGQSAASNMAEPNQDSDVLDYNPENDQRKNSSQ